MSLPVLCAGALDALLMQAQEMKWQAKGDECRQQADENGEQLPPPAQGRAQHADGAGQDDEQHGDEAEQEDDVDVAQLQPLSGAPGLAIGKFLIGGKLQGVISHRGHDGHHETGKDGKQGEEMIAHAVENPVISIAPAQQQRDSSSYCQHDDADDNLLAHGSCQSKAPSFKSSL